MTDRQEQLTLLIHQRGVIKAQGTRFKAYLNKLSQDSTGKNELRIRLEKFEAIFDKFSSIQSEIEFLDPTQAQQTEGKSFEDSFYKLVAQAQERLCRETASTASCSSENSNSTQISNSSTNVSSPQVKLPALTLPTFNGDYDQWLLYKDTFKSLIDNYPDLSEVQKFQYLRGSLQGDALQVIHSLETSQANYKVAWELLQKRYENKHLITHNHMKALFELQTVTKGNFQSLRTLLDNVQKNTRALKMLNQPIDTWDTILIYLISNKLDFNTKRDWEVQVSSKGDETMPSFSNFIEFLTNKCQTLSMIEKMSDKSNQNIQKVVKSRPQSMSHVTNTKVCPVCKGSHQIYGCELFLKMSIPERKEQVKKSRLCYNCLNPNHVLAKCQGSNCRTCNKKHNTLIHTESTETNQITTLTNSNLPTSTVLLSTAVIYAETSRHTKQEMRVLLDSGSQSNFITKEACEKLKLKTEAVNIPVTGISGSKTIITHQVTITISSRLNAFKTKLNFLIIPKITENVPSVNINSNAIKLPSNLRLADPKFMHSSKVDMLIGAEIFMSLMCVGQIRNGPNTPVFQKTQFGWIASGNIVSTKHAYKSNLCTLSLEERISKFWEIEELNKPIFSQEELDCEDHFTNTMKREDGRFIVKLPFNKNVQKLGESRNIAVKRFEAGEKRLRNSGIKSQYTEFMKEYDALKHMVLVEKPEEIEKCYYLPHHTVLKTDSVTTKLRVVFDGSCKT